MKQNRNKILGLVEIYPFLGGKAILPRPGLDFVIEAVLNLHHITLPIIAAKTSFDNGIRLTFPAMHYSNSADFKADLVRYYKNQQKQVIFIGDGGSDLRGALAADFVYSVKGSFLSSQIGIEFADFLELREHFEKLL
jgi:2-hydroxy-3-keto-5-methylthiopentenyl-1-phosphate phosphatase